MDDAQEDNKQEFKVQVDKLINRAKSHGVEIAPGDMFLVVVEKLVNRLDDYRDKPEHKGRLIVE